MTRPGPAHLYDPDAAPATRAAVGDAAWFAANPRARCRVRPMLEGESALLDGLRARNAASRAYVIVIDHARAGDRRAAAGRGLYLAFLPDTDRERARALLAREADRLMAWFRRSAATPPATPSVAMMAGWRP